MGGAVIGRDSLLEGALAGRRLAEGLQTSAQRRGGARPVQGTVIGGENVDGGEMGFDAVGDVGQLAVQVAQQRQGRAAQTFQSRPGQGFEIGVQHAGGGLGFGHGQFGQRPVLHALGAGQDQVDARRALVGQLQTGRPALHALGGGQDAQRRLIGLDRAQGAFDVILGQSRAAFQTGGQGGAERGALIGRRAGQGRRGGGDQPLIAKQVRAQHGQNGLLAAGGG
jgi:hypothetical protein